MAAKEKVLDKEQVNAEVQDSMTVAVTKKEKKYVGPYASVTLPEQEAGDSNAKVDPYEHVTIANEREEMCYKVLRGEKVDVPVPVFMALKAKYPKC